MPADWNRASCLSPIKSVGNLQAASWVDRLLLFRKVRRSMTNGEYITFCDNHEPIR